MTSQHLHVHRPHLNVSYYLVTKEKSISDISRALQTADNFNTAVTLRAFVNVFIPQLNAQKDCSKLSISEVFHRVIALCFSYGKLFTQQALVLPFEGTHVVSFWKAENTRTNCCQLDLFRTELAQHQLANKESAQSSQSKPARVSAKQLIQPHTETIATHLQTDRRAFKLK